MVRRLAAILAADVVGYSSLMAEDEAGTLALLKAHRQEVFDPEVARRRGRIVKLMGDGALVEFGSVVDAVEAALVIQASLNESDGPIRLRIGINLGDIIIDEQDIYGDGVNVAARLETLAAPGGICISSIVNESVGKRTNAEFRDGGEVKVKNIAREVRVYHWHPEGSNQARSQSQKVPGTDRRAHTEVPSIAVLPFDNMSGDAEQDYFSDGISEDIITDLSRVPGLLVIARNSSFAYRNKSVDLRQIGQELGVRTILEGSVRRAGNRVRINAQLIEASTGGHLWANRFDRELTDIFAVQDEVTLDIVNALKLKLTPDEKSRMASIGTADMESHDNFLRMRSILNWPGLNAELWKQAVAYGERAVELDPHYTHAHALLAIISLYDFHNRWSGRPPDTVLSEARNRAELAMRIDPEDYLANHAVAVVARWSGEYDLAASSMEKILSRMPDYSLGLYTRSEIYIARGELDKAIVDLERAMRLDPGFTHQYLQNLGMAHFLLGNFETAVLLFEERVNLISNTDIGRAWLASALGHLGDLDAARQTWDKLMEINPEFSMPQRIARQSFSDPSYVDTILDGLSKAGIDYETEQGRGAD